ncbi:MAG: hypothetical protein WAX69_06670 [Victivallales bacterium]
MESEMDDAALGTMQRTCALRAHMESFAARLAADHVRKGLDPGRLRLKLKELKRTGYDDPSRFSEHFRRFTGLKPLCYRRQITANPHRFPRLKP